MAAREGGNQEERGVKSKCWCWFTRFTTRFTIKLLGVVAFISGQWIPKPSPKPPEEQTKEKLKRILISALVIAYAILITTMFGLLSSLYPTAVLFVEWVTCPIQYYGVCFINVFYSEENKVPVLALKDTQDHSESLNVTSDLPQLKKFNDFAEVTFLFSAISGTISYLILVILLWKKYISQFCTRQTAPQPREQDEHAPLVGPPQNINIPIIHPFDDEPQAKTNSLLDLKESLFFSAFLIINLGLVFAMALVFMFAQYFQATPHPHNDPLLVDNHPPYKTHIFRKVEISTFVVYSYSLMCTISSCFIFSKVMYGIQNKCHGLKNIFTNIVNNRNIEDINVKKADCIREDKAFVDSAIKTLYIYEFWFFVHWVMFIVSSFLSLSLLFDAISLYITATTPHSTKGVLFHSMEMVFLALYATSNSIFFLYPCIRAAGVTESRKVLIREVNNDLECNFKTDFMIYLKGQNFSFRLSILCAHVSFNLNIAYISIFIGLLGVLIRIGTSL